MKPGQSVIPPRTALFLALGVTALLGLSHLLLTVSAAGKRIKTNRWQRGIALKVQPSREQVNPGGSVDIRAVVEFGPEALVEWKDFEVSPVTLPEGFQVFINPESRSGTRFTQRVNLRVAGSVLPGAYRFFLRARFVNPSKRGTIDGSPDPANERIVEVNVDVVAGTPTVPPRYVVFATPANPVMKANGTSSFAVEIRPVSPAFAADTVRVWVEGLPETIQGVFEGQTIRAGATTRLRLSAGTTSPGKYPFKICVAPVTFEENPPDKQFTRVAVIVAGNGETTLHGRVMTAEADALPLPNVTVNAVANPAMQVRTDAQGYFTIRGLSFVHHQVVNIDGHTADTPTETYPVLPIGVDIIPGTANELDYIVYLPKIDTANNVAIQQDADHEQIITTPSVPNGRLIIPPHTFITNADGSLVPQISFTPVPGNRTPMPLPDGLTVNEVPLVYTVQPGGAVTSRPVQIDFPNLIGAQPGSPINLWTADHDLGTFHIFGTGQTVENGTNFLPDPDQNFPGTRFGLTRFSWKFPAPCPPEGSGGAGDLPVNGVGIEPESLSLAPGESASIDIFAYLANGETLYANQYCSFSSSDPTRVIVSSTGLVTVRPPVDFSECSPVNILVNFVSSPPGVKCRGGNSAPQKTIPVSIELRQGNSIAKFKSPGNQIFGNGTQSAIFKDRPVSIELDGQNEQFQVIDKSSNEVIFDGVVNGPANIPIAIGDRQKLEFEVNYGRCGETAKKELTLWVIPNASLSFSPATIGLSPPDSNGNRRTLQDVTFTTELDMEKFNPPLVIETRILRNGEDFAVLGQCGENQPCELVWAAGQMVNPAQDQYEAAVVYQFPFAPEAIVAKRQLFGRRVIESYNPNLISRVATVPGTSTICQDPVFFSGVLSEPATLTFKIQDYPVETVSSPVGAFSRLVRPDFLFGTGSRDFTITARTSDGYEETVFGAISVTSATIGSAFPVGHTYVKNVDILDGHLSLTHSDLSVPGRGLSLEFRRSYSSGESGGPGVLGGRWSHNYESSVVFTQIGSCRYVSLSGAESSIGFQVLTDSNGNPTVYIPQVGYHGALSGGLAQGFIYRTKEGVSYAYSGGAPETGPPLKLLSITDPNGNSLRLGYSKMTDGTWLLRSVTDASGRSINFNYVLAGATPRDLGGWRMTGLNGPGGLSVRYSYNSNGLLSSASREGRHWFYRYKSDESNFGDPGSDLGQVGMLTRVTDPNGNATQYEYYTREDRFEGEGWFPPNCTPGANCAGYLGIAYRTAAVKKITEPDDSNTVFSHDVRDLVATGAHITSVTDGRFNTTQYTVNSTGQVVQIAQPLSVTTQLTWNGTNKTSETDALGRRTTFTYDSLANLTSETIRIQPNEELGITQRDVVTTYSYGPLSRMTSRTDPTGGQTRYEFDSRGNMTAMIVSPDPVGTPGRREYRTEYSYDFQGNLIRKTDSRGFVTRYLYEPESGGKFGKPTRIEEQTKLAFPPETGNPSVLVTINRYDARSRLTYALDPWGKETVTEYDGLDRPVRVVTRDTNSLTAGTSANNEVTFTYYPNGEVFTRIEGRQRITTTLDSRNRPLTVTERDLVIGTTYATTYGYDANNNVTFMRDRRGVGKTTFYDELERPVRVEVSGPFGGPNNGDFTLERKTYDPVGNVLSTTNLYGDVTNFAYDGLYRLRKTTLPIKNPVGQRYVETSLYDDVGNLLSKTDANNHTAFMTYDRLGRRVAMTDAVNRRSQTDYLVESTSPEMERNLTTGLVVTMAYDGKMRPTGATTRFQNPDQPGQTTVYTTATTYDEPSHSMTVTDARGFLNLAQMDAFGRTRRTVTDVAGLALTTWSRYDDRGNLISVIDPEGIDKNDGSRERKFVPDAWNRVVQIIHPPVPDVEGYGTRQYSEFFSYDGEGLKLSQTTRNGKITSFEYDNLQRLRFTRLEQSNTGCIVPVTLRETIDYDDAETGSDGRTHTTIVTDSVGRKILTAFDAANRPISVTDGLESPFARTRTMAYDGVNKIRETDYRQNQTLFTYDAVNRPLTETDPLNRVTRMSYDDVLVQMTVTDHRLIATTKVSDALGRHYRTFVVGVGETSETIVPETKFYDGNGNPLRQLDAVGNAVTWDYDGANRMTRQTLGAGSAAPTIVDTAYDRAGNTLAVVNGRLTKRFIVDALGRRLTETDGVGRTTEKRYDGNGNVVYVRDPYGDERGFTYSETDQVLDVSRINPDSGGFERWTSYFYDGQNRRIQDARPDRVVKRKYDILGRLSREELHRPSGQCDNDLLSFETYEYDADDNQIRLVDGKGQTVEFDYDAVSRLERKRYPGATDGGFGPVVSQFTYLYTATDRVYEIGEQRLGGETRLSRFEYDGLDRVKRETDVFGKDTLFTYLPTGLRQSRTDATGRVVTYGYDGQNRLSSMSYGRQLAMSYGPDGLVSSVLHGGIATSYDY